MSLLLSTLLTLPITSNNLEYIRLRRLQDSINNITTYVNGELSIVEYPANTAGQPVSPWHVWVMLITHDMPRLFCFHRREAWIRMPGPYIVATAMCRSENDFCGYLVDFFRIAGHPDVRTKVYNYRESAIRIAMETTFFNEYEPEDSPPPSTVATRATTPNLEIGPDNIPDTPPPPYRTPLTPNAARHDNNALPQHQEGSGQDIQDVFASLQTRGGVTARRFWSLFRQCRFCNSIVMKNSQHHCMTVIDLTTEDDPTIIDLTNDDEEIV